MTDVPNNDLLGYLLGLLEAEDHARISSLLELDSIAREWADLFRRRVEEFAIQQEHLAPPSGLAVRSCNYVRLRRSESVGDDATNAPSQ